MHESLQICPPTSGRLCTAARVTLCRRCGAARMIAAFVAMLLAVSQAVVLGACSSRSSQSVAAPVRANATEQPRVVANWNSHFGRVIVVDTGSLRCLRFNQVSGVDQSCMDLGHPDRVVHEYVKWMAAGLAFVPDDSSVLVVGLGGGILPKMIERYAPKMRTDVVEIDPAVVRVAREYFSVGETGQRKIHIADGREYLARSGQHWHLIMLDAYADDVVPFHLTTVEFLRLVRLRLLPGGLVVSNLWYRNGPLFRAMVKTYRETFTSVAVLQSARSGNAIIVARDDRLPDDEQGWRQRLDEYARSRSFDFPFAAPADGFVDVHRMSMEDVPVLIDQHEDAFKHLGPM